MILEAQFNDDLVLRQVAKIAAQYLSDDIDKNIYYVFLYSELLVGKLKVFFTAEGDKLTSVAVVTFGEGVDGKPYASTDFVWIDPHYPKLFKEYLQRIEDMGIKKILVPTVRNEKAFLRKYGKYGFRKKYVVFEKVM